MILSYKNNTRNLHFYRKLPPLVSMAMIVQSKRIIQSKDEYYSMTEQIALTCNLCLTPSSRISNSTTKQCIDCKNTVIVQWPYIVSNNWIIPNPKLKSVQRNNIYIVFRVSDGKLSETYEKLMLRSIENAKR